MSNVLCFSGIDLKEAIRKANKWIKNNPNHKIIHLEGNKNDFFISVIEDYKYDENCYWKTLRLARRHE